MPKVIFISEQKLESYLDRSADLGKRVGYYSCLDLSVELRASLSQAGFNQASASVIDQEFRAKFIAQYLGLMGECANTCDSKLWQASDIASKNRFTSRLVQLLNSFLQIISNVKKADFDSLLVIGPDPAIIKALKAELSKTNINLECSVEELSVFKLKALGFLRRLAAFFYNLFKVYSRHVLSWIKLSSKLKELKPDNPYYVVKTFIYNHSFNQNSYKDPFFGPLPDFLLEKNKNPFIFACVLGDYSLSIDKMAEYKKYPILPLEIFVNLGDIFKAGVRYLFSDLKIKSSVKFFSLDVSSIINNEILNKYGDVQFFHLLHYYATKNLLKKIKADKFLLTYENNPWEKMSETAIREVMPETRILGYQHTVVPQASVNMFVSADELKKMPMPDKILTVGSIPKDIMEEFSQYPQDMIQPACGLRFEYLFNAQSFKRKKEGKVLLALEGIFDVYKMINYVLKELKNHQRYSITIRTHPTLPLKYFKGKIEYDLTAIKNLKISCDTSLKEDIEDSDFVVYWGTTVALEALSLGKPVIHFDLGSTLSYDPLFACNYLKYKVNKTQSLAGLLDKIDSLEQAQFEAALLKAREYLSCYFHPISDSKLETFLL